ncbi:MAG: NAD-dependent epimerase/dehydratase family protein [Anaerolineae bacterium]|nr:NAD-dependent epimerase/dehydratase family protein [Anaerolineae bacterium]
MKVLIVGGTGLISTAITRTLAQRGERVVLYNRGQREAELPAGVERIVGDRTAYTAFEEHMAQAGPFDCVIDMVCFKPEDAESAVRAFRGRIGQYVFCSTVDVYAKPAAHYPIREGAERKPAASFPYAYRKAACERLLEEAHARGDFSVTMIRPAWTYGEGGSILHTFGWNTYFLDRLRKGKPVIVHGDGTSLWSACHRDDVGRAFAGAAGNERAFGKGYHVTGEEWMTWNAYTKVVAQAVGGPPPALVHIPSDLLGKVVPKAAEWCVENFSFNNIFDNAAARTDLGFEYTTSFLEGARRVIEWLEGHGGFEDSDWHPFYDRIIAAWERLGEEMASDLDGLDA